METFTFIGESERREPVMLLVLVFALIASAATLTACCMSMPSMTGARPCGQTWFGAAASFIGMWTVMMTAMMLPSFAGTLWRHRRCGARPLALMSAGYVAAWTVPGIVIYSLGALWTTLAMTMPAASGAFIVLAGACQSSAWKRRRLAACRGYSACERGALRHGVRYGMHCVASCGALTAALCVTGMTDLRAAAAVTAAITAERLLPGGEHIAKGVGMFMIALGSVWVYA